MLEIKQVSKAFHGPQAVINAVRDVSLTVRAGEFTAVQGPSGCGKTTLLLAAGGLLQPDAGTVCVNGTDLYALPSEPRARFRAAHLGFVFQQFHLIPYLSVLDNVLTPALAFNIPEARTRAVDLITRFGLKERLHHVPAELSTGERQRAALARALLNQPKLLLADEPTGNLDEENGRRVLGCLSDYAKQGGAVLLVTHDPRVAEYAGTLVQIKDGRRV
ncbi:MAG: ABC transporter ATP-binding protein [Verrucomicrobiota bacterium]